MYPHLIRSKMPNASGINAFQPEPEPEPESSSWVSPIHIAHMATKLSIPSMAPAYSTVLPVASGPTAAPAFDTLVP